ncbi:hypothetical protein T492DRAFT_951060 [Pavlovales sp. CCMP2436]|nr:hypothetical protein T492DRAFT_951060 [Pavlovales sp. CCMP2436]
MLRAGLLRAARGMPAGSRGMSTTVHRRAQRAASAVESRLVAASERTRLVAPLRTAWLLRAARWDQPAVSRSRSKANTPEAKVNALLMAASKPEEVLKLFAAHGQSFDAVNLSTAWGRISRSTHDSSASERAAFFGQHEPALHRLQVSVSERIGDFRARELANTAYASACLPYAPALELLEKVRDHALAHASSFQPHELASLAWGFARSGVHPGPIFTLVEAEARGKLSRFKAVDLASLAWAFAKEGSGAHPQADALFGELAREAEGRIGEFSARSLFNLAWAFATSRRSDERLFHAIACAATPLVSHFSPQELCIIAWAVGRTRARQPEFLRELAAAAAPNACELDPKHVVMLLWSAVRCGVTDAALLRALSREVQRTAEQYEPLELALVLWAATKTSCPQFDASPLFAAAATEIAPRTNACDIRALSLLTYAASISGHAQEATPLFEALEYELPARAASVRLPDLVRIVWALAVAGRLPPLLVGALFERVNALDATALQGESVRLHVQLHQLVLSLRYLAPHLALALAPEHAAACARALRHDSAVCGPSALHFSVSASLGAAGVAHENEYVVPELGSTVDIVLTNFPADADPGSEPLIPREPLLIEVNGPHHYLPSGALRPASALKLAHLRAAGWRVLTIEHEEWRALPNEPARQVFIGELLGLQGMRDRFRRREGSAAVAVGSSL